MILSKQRDEAIALASRSHVAWLALYKRYATRDWVVYAEKFGIPLPIVTFPERPEL